MIKWNRKKHRPIYSYRKHAQLTKKFLKKFEVLSLRDLERNFFNPKTLSLEVIAVGYNKNEYDPKNSNYVVSLNILHYRDLDVLKKKFKRNKYLDWHDDIKYYMVTCNIYPHKKNKFKLPEVGDTVEATISLYRTGHLRVINIEGYQTSRKIRRRIRR